MSEPPVRTLHVMHTTNRRGAEMSTVHLVTALRDRGLDSRVVALSPGDAGDQLDVDVLGRHGRSPAAIARLRRQVGEVDVVVAHGASALLACYLATRASTTPFVYRMIGDPEFWGRVRFADLRIGLPLRAAATVVPLWEDAARAVERMYRVPRERLRVIVNGRDPSRLRPPTLDERSDLRRELGLPTDRRLVGYLGALREEKDPLLAVRVAQATPDVHLVVAGDGEMRPEVEAEASAATVTLLGPVDDPQRLLWAVDVLLLTSRTEGLPGAVIEAGFCGVPAVAPDVGGTADLVDATTGTLVPAGSDVATYAAALAEVLDDRVARGAALRERCEATMVVGAAADRWVELLTELRAARPGAR